MPARTLTFRWRTSEDDERDAAERLRDEAKLVEHEVGKERSSKDKD